MDVYFFKEDGLDDVCRLLLSLTQPHELISRQILQIHISILGWILINLNKTKILF